MDNNAAVIRLPPYYYVHVLDTNENVTQVICGPATVTRRDHERVVLGPRKMLIVPPAHFCVIADPIVRSASGEPVMERGQFKVNFGELEVRRTSEPFFLYPGESVAVGVTPMTIVPENCALRLRAQRQIVEPAPGLTREAGDEWYFEGPGTYIPHVAVQIVEPVDAIKLDPTQALRLRARNDCLDYKRVRRTAGEEWLVRDMTLYLPNVEEVVVCIVDPLMLTDSTALHLRALSSFVDVFGTERKAGQEWLVTKDRTPMYVTDVCEELVNVPRATVLNNRQYCVVVDPVDPATGLPQLGRSVLRTGPLSFFLQPNESLRAGVQAVEVLGANEALLVRAVESFRDDSLAGVAPVARCAGDRWLVEGPCEYFPPCSVEIIQRRSAIPLDANEGIYVRDMNGAVRSVTGKTYLLRETEELWEKELQPGVEALLTRYGGPATRDRTRVVSFQIPYNAATQVYDYRKKSARVVFGPDLVTLEPDEQLTVLNLSGGKPKRANQIRDLCIFLGPDFSTDILTVETSDHARLDVRLSYGWHFEANRADADAGRALFQVPDFVGDMCKAIASRVRGAVAGVPFDDFHKHSADIINRAVFGVDSATNLPKKRLAFPSNLLVVDAVDIQSVEPVDKSTRDSLMQSVQMAITITTDALEAQATNAARKKEQLAMAELSRQRIRDEAKVEEARQTLIQLTAESRAVQTTGTATAEAEARAKAQQIVGESEVKLAQLRANAADIFAAAELKRMSEYQAAEVAHQKSVDELDVAAKRRKKDIEAAKFRDTVSALGTSTILDMARAGPELQAQLLAGLGVTSHVITSGSTPMNLFDSALGLLSQSQPQ